MVPITFDHARLLLGRDVAWAEEAVNDLVRPALAQGQFDCLVLFVFNVGRAAFGASHVRTRVNEGKFDAVPAELRKWINAGGKRLAGLVKRREAEIALWNGTHMRTQEV